MKTVVVAIIVALISGFSTFYVTQQRGAKNLSRDHLEELAAAEQQVKKRIQQITTKLEQQLSGFSDAVGTDNDFQMKLLVENDKSSPKVTDIAGHYMKAMAFSALVIADSSYTILSSGHFPASVGSDIKNKGASLTSKPSVITENSMGKEVLTLQAKKEFKIADFPFSAIGGLEITDALLEELSPGENIKVLLRYGSDYRGMKGIKAISEIKDHKIIINDKEYYAAQIQISSSKKEEPAYLLVVMDQTEEK